MEIVAISGSLQAASSNTALLAAAATIAPEGVRVTPTVSPGVLPHFNPDLDGSPTPEAVTRFRAQLATADAVLIATPEYAHSLPGSLKNALDWIVGSGELYGKPVAILAGSPREDGARQGRAAPEQTLRAQGAVIVVSRTVAVPRSGEPELGVGAPAIAAIRETLDVLTIAAPPPTVDGS